MNFFLLLLSSFLTFSLLFSFKFITFADYEGLDKRAPAGQVLGTSEENGGAEDALKTEPSAANPPLTGKQELTLKEDALPLDLAVESAFAVDSSSGTVLFSKNSPESRPPASIVKLMTAMVFLEHNPVWDNVYEVQPADRRQGGRIYIFNGEKIRTRDLFYLSLVASDNTATAALIKSLGLSEEMFVQEMNEKAASLGLKRTKFYDALGLDDRNVSTAEEIARFVEAGLKQEEISRATLSKSYEFFTLNAVSRKKVVYNTDILLDIFPQNGIKILGGKTGYTAAAGYCFAGRFINEAGREIVSVVLGGDTPASRFTETDKLIKWIFANYQWPEKESEQTPLSAGNTGAAFSAIE